MRATHLALALTALALAVPAQTTPSKDASFGTWPFLVGNMDPQIPNVVAAAVANDLDTIYVSVFRTTGPQTGTLWITDDAKRWNAAWGPVRTGGAGIDLRDLINAAHAAKLQVVGVLKCFDDTVQPTDAAHRAYLLQVIDYLLSSYDSSGQPYYDVDGLALDYIRYVGSGSCSNDPTVVTDFCRDVKARLGARSLHAYLIASRYYFDGPPYNGTFNSYTSVMSSLASCYGQDWQQLAQYVDVMMPMAYTADGSIYNTYALHQAYVRTVAQYCRAACTRAGYVRRVSPAIRTWTDSSETCTPQTIDASITGALQGGGDGYQAFRYKTITSSSWWAVLKQYAAPGQNRPVPIVGVTTSGLTAAADATNSVDGDQSSATLQVRFDLGNDGSYEVPWGSNVPADLLASKPGSVPIGVQVMDQDGNVGATTRQATLANPLLLGQSLLSAQAGGAVQVNLDAGSGAAGMSYVVVASLAGSLPGTTVAPGLVLPLNVDALTFGLLGAINTPLLQNGFGTLDAQGKGSATFAVPPGLLAPIRSRIMTWAGVGADGSGQPLFVTNPALLFISN